MPIYEDGKYQAFYIGDMHPVKIMDGNDVIVQAKPLELTGTALAFADTYNDTVQGLTVFGNSEQVTTVQGKNLFDLQKLTQNKDWVVKALYKSYSLKPNTQYTLSSNVPTTTAANVYFNGISTYTSGVWLGKSATTTSDANGNLYVAIPISPLREHTQEIINGTYWIQLEEGSTATTYAPFVPNSPSPDYPSPITSVGDTNGVTVTVTDGAAKSASATRSVILRSLPDGTRDTYNPITGVVTRNIGIKVFDGNETCGALGPANGAVAYEFFAALSLQAKYDNQTVLCHSTHFAGASRNATYGTAQDGIIAVGTNYCRIRYNTLNGDVAALKSWLASQYAAGTPVTVQYELATHTTETVAPITLPTYPGQTHLDAGGAELTATCRVVDL